MQKERCEVPGCKRIAWGIGFQLYRKRHTEEVFSKRLGCLVVFNSNTGVDDISGKTWQELNREIRVK